MAIVKPVVNGEIQDSLSSNSLGNKTNKPGGALGKDAFLQLLVTQMKYQDPLSPMENTEYISQLATFSQLEELQNMGESMNISKALSLTGQLVMMKVTNAVTGETGFVTGYVDYITIENGKAYLNIKGQDYSIDDLYNVVDQEYWDALQDLMEGNSGTDTTKPTDPDEEDPEKDDTTEEGK